MGTTRTIMNLCTRSLAESMDVRTMIHLVREYLPHYNLHERTGFPKSLSIPNVDAARQIINDVHKEQILMPFINNLLKIQEHGLMGRRYSLPYLREIVKGIYDLGFIYDAETHMFVEDSRKRITKNWGVLQEGKDYGLSFVRFDIVENSKLVRKYPSQVISSVYKKIGDIVQRSMLKRNGRIWSLEGDGGIGAFYLNRRNTQAALAAMHILHTIYMYNIVECPLDNPVQIRIAVHSGTTEFVQDERDLKKSDTIKQLMDLENNFTSPDSVTISQVVHNMLDPIVLSQFGKMRNTIHNNYNYKIRWQ